MDEIYRLLETLEEDAAALKGVRHKRVSAYQYPGILDAADFLASLDMGQRLGLNGMDLAKLSKPGATYDSTVLWQLTGRLSSLLREAEGMFSGITGYSGNSLPPLADPPSDVPAGIVAVEWVEVDQRKSRDIITELAQLLDEAVVLASRTNLPADKTAFTEFQRKHLIAMLETALLMLKAPLVEKGLLKKLAGSAGEGAQAAVKKGSELGLAFLLKRIGEEITKLLGLL